MSEKIAKIAIILSLFWILLNNSQQAALAEDMQIEISEILPNPKGKDKNNEWIELYNPNQHEINLKNWQIIESDPTDINKKSKKILLPDSLVISGKSYLVLRDKTLKITLLNKNSKIELKDPQNNIIDTVSYKKAKDGLSLSKIIIKNKKAWVWTSPSKDKPNPIYREKSAQKIQPQQVKQTQPPTENWLKYSIIPISILLWILYKVFRLHRIKDDLRDISSS